MSDPKLKVHLGPHVTEEDALIAKPLINEANVLIPEITACTDNVLKLYNKVAQGSYKDIVRLKQSLASDSTGFIGGQIQSVYMRPKNGRLSVTTMDVPPTHEWKRKMKAIRESEKGFGIFPSINASVQNIEDRFRTFWTLQNEREHVIADNIAEYFAGESKFELPQTPRPLMIIGYLHDGIINKLHQREVAAVKSDISYDGPEHYHDTVTRTFQDGERPDRELLLRTFLGSLIGGERVDGVIHIARTNTENRLAIERKIVDSIPVGELEKTVQIVIDETFRNGLEGATVAADNLLRDITGHSVLGDEQIEDFLSR